MNDTPAAAAAATTTKQKTKRKTLRTLERLILWASVWYLFTFLSTVALGSVCLLSIHIFSLWAHCSCLAAIVWINCVYIEQPECALHFLLLLLLLLRFAIAAVCHYFGAEFSIWQCRQTQHLLNEKKQKQINVWSMNNAEDKKPFAENVVIISSFRVWIGSVVCRALRLDNPGQ